MTTEEQDHTEFMNGDQYCDWMTAELHIAKAEYFKHRDSGGAAPGGLYPYPTEFEQQVWISHFRKCLWLDPKATCDEAGMHEICQQIHRLTRSADKNK